MRWTIQGVIRYSKLLQSITKLSTTKNEHFIANDTTREARLQNTYSHMVGKGRLNVKNVSPSSLISNSSRLPWRVFIDKHVSKEISAAHQKYFNICTFRVITFFSSLVAKEELASTDQEIARPAICTYFRWKQTTCLFIFVLVEQDKSVGSHQSSCVAWRWRYVAKVGTWVARAHSIATRFSIIIFGDRLKVTWIPHRFEF